VIGFDADELDVWQRFDNEFGVVDRDGSVELPVKYQNWTLDRLVVNDGKFAAPAFVVKRPVDAGAGGEDG